jgi:hypothetical protein
MTSNTAHAAQAVIVRPEDAELLELPSVAFRLLADSGATQGTVSASPLSLGTGADGAEPTPAPGSCSTWSTAPWRSSSTTMCRSSSQETSSWCHRDAPRVRRNPELDRRRAGRHRSGRRTVRILPPSSTDRPRPGARRDSRARARALRRPPHRQCHVVAAVRKPERVQSPHRSVCGGAINLGAEHAAVSN